MIIARQRMPKILHLKAHVRHRLHRGRCYLQQRKVAPNRPTIAKARVAREMLGNWSALWLSARKDIRFSATPLGWSAMFQQSQCQRHKYGRPHGEEGLPRPITGIAISGLLGPHGAAFQGRLKSQCAQAKRAQVEKPSQPKPKLAEPPFKATAEGVCPRPHDHQAQHHYQTVSSICSK